MQMWLRVKRLVNDGELSKSARVINGAGVAEPLEKIVAELREKYPKRVSEIIWPCLSEILERQVLAKTAEQIRGAKKRGKKERVDGH